MSLRDEIDQMMRARLLEASGVERAMLEGRPVDISAREAWQAVALNLEAIKAAIGRLADEVDDLRPNI